MKRLILLLALFPTIVLAQSTFHDYKALTIDGDSISMSVFKGKKLMVVNTASLCGYTYQYSELQQLYDRYKSQNFEIVGFPSNDFGSQEPGSDSTIKDFCEKNYGVTFQMMSKIKVTGTTKHPIYKWLTSKSMNGVLESSVVWNFQKYLIDENGKLVGMYSTQTSPLSSKISDWIKTTGINDNVSDDINLYPQPANEYISIETAGLSLNNITIADMLGRELFVLPLDQATSNTIQINITDYARGMYIVRLSSEDGNYVKYFVKD